mmetsp:Transcript_81321/g.252386  ORF Transcript_81321/g.252386 Transcript_81321/m.252386 type:complete len:743 (-) Transcript_81321:344-2572(-)
MLGGISDRPTAGGQRALRRGPSFINEIRELSSSPDRPASAATYLRPCSSSSSSRGQLGNPNAYRRRPLLEAALSRPSSCMSRPSSCMSFGGQAGGMRPSSLLVGVSSDAERQNTRTGRGLNMLLQQDSRDQETSQWDVVAEADTNVDEQSFVRTSDLLSTSIEALRGRHTAFEGVPMAAGPRGDWSRTSAARKSCAGARPSSAHRSAGGGSEEESTLAERLQAYKYFRRFDREDVPELSASPPALLPRNASCPGGLSGVARPVTCFPKYNASEEALQCWFPEARRRTEDKKKIIRRIRAEEVIVQREQMIADSTLRWTKVLQRKREQGDQAIVSRRTCLSDRAFQFLGMSQSPPSSPSGGQDNSFEMQTILAEHWAKLIVAISVAQQFCHGIDFVRKDHDDRMALLGKLNTASSRILRRSCMVQKTLEMSALMEETKPFSERLITLALVFKTALEVRKQRRNASTIHDCLNHWQVAGRAFVSMRRFATMMKKLQRWWREASVKLRDHRNMISARWELLEKTAVAEEEHKRMDAYMKTGARFQTSSLSGATVSEVCRLRFLDHELRARRVMLLPLLYIWEEDARRWRSDLEEWRETRAAHKALGIDGGGAFRWPPTRPSYLPPAHPNHEAFGLECPEDCPGRRGDEEILAMWRSARRHPKGGGWRKIPCASCTKFNKSDKRGSRSLSKASTSRKSWDSSSSTAPAAAPGQEGAVSTMTSPFAGAATEEDLRHWGIDAIVLPGL